LNRFGRYAEAQPLIEFAMNTRRKVLGERHPDTAVSFEQVGRLQLNQDRFEEAKKNLNQSMYIRKTKFGSNHPETVTAMHAYGRYCWVIGTRGDENALAEGRPMLEKVMGLRLS
jgi:hypothetical protein